MDKKDIKINAKSTPSILAHDLKIEGNIVGAGIVEIEGSIKGNIKSNAIIIREIGNVEGDIFADNLTIKGSFNGKVKANNVNITNKAKVTGIIEYGSLCVEDGASIDGQFKKIGSAAKEEKSSK